jgi:hypothetical protein
MNLRRFKTPPRKIIHDGWTYPYIVHSSWDSCTIVHLRPNVAFCFEGQWDAFIFAQNYHKSQMQKDLRLRKFICITCFVLIVAILITRKAIMLWSS